MIEHVRMMTAYNAWANAQLYRASAHLDDAAFRADRGAFFKSVHGTLNHLLVTDRIWMQRFSGMGEAPDRLDAILFDSFPALRAAREAEDQRIEDYIRSMGDDDLTRVIRYRRVSTLEQYEQSLPLALSHLFNHQTHDRGQIHALLTGLSGEAPSLDLLLFQRAGASAQS